MTENLLTAEDENTVVAPAEQARRSGIPSLWGILPILIGIAVWQLASSGHSVYFSPPSSWMHGLEQLWTRGVLLRGIRDTVLTWIEGLVLATVAGTALGMLIGRSRFWDSTLGPGLEFIRVIPASAVVPIVVLVAGYTINMQLAIVMFGALWPCLLGVRNAAQRIRPQLLEVGRSLGLSRPAIIRKLMFPSVVPALLTGVRVSAPMTLVLTLLVEILTQVGGLGALMITAQQNFDSGQLYGLICIAGVLGLIAGWGVSLLVRKAERYLVGT